ncbi:NACHT and WD repeat domain-containing protein [Actinosynnema sp. CS-041913]|uniref:NACHT and WD repeat domain-containing protein n=1 Tax=Actinosynnema sp. CS-041913 TaxID=3239917 RepID=UPI003D8F7923
MNSIADFGAALASLKARSGFSLSQLAGATATRPGAGGLGRSTLNGYFKGRHLPQQGVVREFRLLLRELGVEDSARLAEWWATVERLRRRSCDSSPTAGNPYQGLRSFDVGDAARFFGRQALTARLVQAVETGAGSGRPVVVVGPSGSGKSSLLRAGLLTGAAEDRWRHVVMTPGGAPLDELAARFAAWTRHAPESALAGLRVRPSAFGNLVRGGHDAEPSARRCLLVVDQLEQLFVGEVEEAERRAFFAAVWSVAQTGAVVLGLRADFYGHVLRYPAPAAAVQADQVVVPPMSEPELRAVIVEPARTAGFDVDDGLVELLLRDLSPNSAPELGIAHEQGALPLLSHALRVTFEVAMARDERSLGIDAYRSTGGMRRAIADTAESIYRELDHDARCVARQVLLRMVHVDDGAVDTRRVVDRQELAGQRPDAEAEAIDDVLEAFIKQRLLTAHDSTMQISHDALLRAWPRLSGWLDDDRVGRRVHRRLTLAARYWRDNGATDDDLYQGATLDTALCWAAESDHQAALNPLERDFLTAGVRRKDAEQAASRRRVRLKYQFVSAALVMVVIAAAAVLYARRTWEDTEHQARLTRSRDMAAKSVRLRQSDTSLAAELAAAAYRTAPTVEARSALLDSSALPIAARHRGRGGSTNVLAATKTLIATGAKNGAVALSHVRPRTPVGPVLDLGSRVVAVAISDDDRLLTAVAEDGTARLWNIGAPDEPVEVARLAGPSGAVASAAFSPDGRLLAIGGGDAVTRVWDTADTTRHLTLSGPGGAITGVAFAPGGRTLAVGSRDRTVHLYDLAAPDRSPPVRLRGPEGAVFSVAFGPDGRTLAAATSADRAVYLWDVADPAAPVPLGTLTGPESWVDYVDFSPDGSRVVAGSSDQKLWEWDVRTRAVAGVYPHPGVAHMVRYLDEHTVLTLTEDGMMRTWTVPGPSVGGFGDTVFTVEFTRTGQYAVVGTGGRGNQVHALDMSAPDLPVRLEAPFARADVPGRFRGRVALDDENHLLAAGTDDGTIELWSVGTPAGRTPAHRIADAATAGRSHVTGLDFRPRGADLAVATADGVVTLLNVADHRNPRQSAVVRESGSALNEVRFSPDGALMATGSDDGNAYLYAVGDPSGPRLLAALPAGDAATSVAFDAGSTTLAVASAAHDNVQLWDIRTPTTPARVAQPLAGPVADIYRIAFNPARDQLAIGSVDGTIGFWDVRDPAEPEHKATVTAAGGAVMSIGYSPDGGVIAAGTRDANIRVWRTDPESTIRWICDTTGEHITEGEWEQLLPRTTYTPAC